MRSAPSMPLFHDWPADRFPSNAQRNVTAVESHGPVPLLQLHGATPRRQLFPPPALCGAECWWTRNARNGTLHGTVPCAASLSGRGRSSSLPAIPSARPRHPWMAPPAFFLSCSISTSSAASPCSAAPSGRWWTRNVGNGALHGTVPGAANLRTRRHPPPNARTSTPRCRPCPPDARTPAQPGRQGPG